MRQNGKRLIIFLLYVFLLLGCAGIVWFAGRLAGDSDRDRLPASIETETAAEPPATPPDAESAGETLPADAGHAGPDADKGGAGQDGAWSEAYRRWRWENRHPAQETAPAETVPEEEPYVPPTIMLASDLHYMSSTTHDDGEAFQKMLKQDDGKVSQYSEEMIDALCQEAIDTRPAVLVLSGDITLNGERENHERLAEKLRRVQEAGVQVAVIPGNHDIQNKNAATYFGGKKEKAEYLHSAEEFLEIYHEFGYDQSPNRDPDSLSYVLPIDETHWLLMLDSCRYEDYNHVSGRLKDETLDWLEVHLQVAKEHGIAVLPVAHHNLLSQSRMYTTECTLDNSGAVIELLEQYEVPLYVSGHLHAQRIKKHMAGPGTPADAYGITEIVLGPYSITPNQYGVLSWNEAGDMEFHTRSADVAGYAAAQGSQNEELLQFPEFSLNFTREVIKSQAAEEISGIPQNLEEEMTTLYANLYLDYCSGSRMTWDAVEVTGGYKLWQRVAPDSVYVKRMAQMVEDVRDDLHDWEWENPGPGAR